MKRNIAGFIPAGPDDLDDEWLTRTFRQSNLIDRSCVVSSERQTIGIESGTRAQLVRVRLKYDLSEPGAPKSVIAKFSSDRSAMRDRNVIAYNNEVKFYQTLADRSKVPSPVCYYANIDTKANNHLILLEDLAPAVSGSRILGCSGQQAESAVKHIAEFHASWWEKPSLNEIKWLPSPSRNIVLDPVERQSLYDQWWIAFFNKAAHHLPDHLVNMGKFLGKHQSWIEEYAANATPRTLIHGDFSLENVLFSTNQGGSNITIIDWQSIGHGYGIFDVAYFLVEGLRTEDRRSFETDLLRGYHNLLCENGVVGYTFEQCMYDYRISLLRRFRQLVSTVAVVPLRTDHLDMHINVCLPRNIAAIIDHKAYEILQ